jgi:DNA-binding transcriptional regulator YdaS (Cro superfamily)
MPGMSYPTTLARFLSESGTSAGAFARLVKADRSQIYRCASGERGPSIELAVEIERATKGAVPVESWAKPVKKARRNRAS